MTLFALAAEDGGDLYRQAIDRWCDGHMDEKTLALLGRS
jgi:uncharacterized protein (DUF1810 family)